MIGAPDKGLTLRGILLERQSAAEVARALQEAGIAGTLDRRLGGMPPRLRAAAGQEVIEAIVRVLDIGLIDVLAGAWKTWDELVGAARHSLELPEQTEIVELVDHRISSSHRPRVDVSLDDRRVASITVAIDVGIELRAVRAVVANGRLTALPSGWADVEAVLAVEGVEATRGSRSVELAFEVGLGAGILLAGTPDLVILPPSPAIERTSATWTSLAPRPSQG